MPLFKVVEEFPQAMVRIVRHVRAKTKEEAEEGIGDRPYSNRISDGDEPGLVVDFGGEARTAIDETEELKPSKKGGKA